MGSKRAVASRLATATRQKLSLLLCISLLAAFTSCGGGSSPAADKQQPAQGGFAVPPPSVLREASYQPAALVREGRWYANSPASLHQNVSYTGTIGVFNPDWSPDAPDFAGLAFACYSFSLADYDRAQQITFYWDERADLEDLWIGLADFERDAWSWHSLPQDGPLEFETLALDLSPFISPDSNNLYVVVLATGTASWRLDRIQVGDLTSVSGYVAEGSIDTPSPDANVMLEGAQEYLALTDDAGRWQIDGVLPGDYELSVYKLGWTYAPESRQFTVAGLQQEADAFTGTQLPLHTASGYVEKADETPFGYVTMEFSAHDQFQSSAYANTAQDGAWSIDLPDGDYTVDPHKADWVFTPETRDFTVAGGAVEVGDFTGEFHLKQLDGYVYLDDGVTPVEGVCMWLFFGWDERLTGYTDETGYYVFTDLSEAQYDVSPHKYGYEISPDFQVIYLDTDTTAEPFLASLEPTYQLDGYVYVSDGTTGAIDVPILVEVQMSEQTFETSTDFHGYWQVSGVAPTYCRVTPSKAGWEFDPDYRYVTVTDTDVRVGDFVRAN